MSRTIKDTKKAREERPHKCKCDRCTRERQKIVKYSLDKKLAAQYN